MQPTLEVSLLDLQSYILEQERSDRVINAVAETKYL